MKSTLGRIKNRLDIANEESSELKDLTVGTTQNRTK